MKKPQEGRGPNKHMPTTTGSRKVCPGDQRGYVCGTCRLIQYTDECKLCESVLPWGSDAKYGIGNAEVTVEQPQQEHVKPDVPLDGIIQHTLHETPTLNSEDCQDSKKGFCFDKELDSKGSLRFDNDKDPNRIGKELKDFFLSEPGSTEHQPATFELAEFHSHASSQKGRPDEETHRSGRGGSKELDKSTGPSSPPRTGCRESSGREPIGPGHGTPQEGTQDWQARPDQPHETRPQDDHDRQRDDDDPDAEGHRAYPQALSESGMRLPSVRQARRPHIRGSEPAGSCLCGVGCHHSSGGTKFMAAYSLCHLGPQAGSGQGGETGAATATSPDVSGRQQQQLLESSEEGGQGGIANRGEQGRSHSTSAGRASRCHTGPSQGATGDVSEGESDDEEVEIAEKVFSREDADIISSHQCLLNQLCDSWNSLVKDDRPLLMELACEQDSVLSTVVEQKLGKGKAIRCSWWNQCDLETPKGIKNAIQQCKERRPLNLWISTECGPYSPMQNGNQRTEQQARDLEGKRERAQLQYKGAATVARAASKMGIIVHWEWSEHCRAWSLDVFTSLAKELQFMFAVTKGCTVGLKTPDTQELMGKGWKIATQCPNMAKHMNLACQGNHTHASCEGGRRTQHSALYTPAFAKRVVSCMLKRETWETLVREVQYSESDTSVPICWRKDYQTGSKEVDSDFKAYTVENQENKPLTPQQKVELHKKLQQIHSVTGHGSLKNLLDSLKRRGVSAKILEEAKNFKCPICEERSKTAPRRPATLEVPPGKWTTIQSDIGTWTHPNSMEKSKFILFVDEGCRFRVGRVLFTHKTKNATWDMIKEAYEEQWKSHYGQPLSLRVDPEGAWRTKEAEDYFAERSVLFESIPAEAHWQIGIVERAIQGIKRCMTDLAKEFPNFGVKELFARALYAGNSMEVYKGYSPLQHALGRAPDEYGRIYETDVKVSPSMTVGGLDAEFGTSIQAMNIAAKAFLDENAHQRLMRAEHAGHRRYKVFKPGDLVYYWRKMVSKNDRKHTPAGGFSNGRYLGPARVLATETRRDESGNPRPGSIVWLHRAGRVLKAAPEQLRQASEREELLESLEGPLHLPWTMQSLLESPGNHTYDDISGETPSEEDLRRYEERP